MQWTYDRKWFIVKMTMSTEYTGRYNREYSVDGGSGVPRKAAQSSVTAGSLDFSDFGEDLVRVNSSPNARQHRALLRSLVQRATGRASKARLERDFRSLATFEAIEIGRHAKGLGHTGLREIRYNLEEVQDSDMTGLPYSVHDRLSGHWDVAMATEVGPLAEISAEQQLIDALAPPAFDVDEDTDIGVLASRAVSLKVGNYYTSRLQHDEVDEGYEQMKLLLSRDIAVRPEDDLLTGRLKGIHDILGAAVLIGHLPPAGS